MKAAVTNAAGPIENWKRILFFSEDMDLKLILKAYFL